MKRTVFFLMLALLCATSHAQINPKMQQLFDKLTEIGETPRIIKHGGKDQPTVLEYGVHLYYSPNMYRDSHTPFIDSLLREDKNNLEQGLAAIRHTLDDLQAEAAESYHYEYHKGGRDTIVYSMNLCRDTVLNTSKHRSVSHPLFYSNEYLYFNYQPYHKEGEVGANLQYTVNIPSPGPQAEKNSFESLVADIVKLFNQNKIKPRTAMWQHDKAYSDSILAAKIPAFESMVCIGGHGNEGKTNAQIFTVPCEQEEKARRLYDEISRMALRFTEGNLDVMYRYNYLPFEDSFWGAIMACYTLDETQSYTIDMRRNESGFHFVITQTNGMEWFPASWSSIKSFVNGKVTFFKGMKPKEKQ